MSENGIKWDQPKPHAFIQWKGTDVCADVRCECGAVYHYDGWFFYAVTCEACGKTWTVEPFVRLVAYDDKDGGDPIVLKANGERGVPEPEFELLDREAAGFELKDWQVENGAQYPRLELKPAERTL